VPLIVLEGPEGAGKTTQVKLLAEALTRAGHDVKTLREPGGTAVGDEIRKILLDHPGSDIVARAESLLYMASRAQLVEKEIAPALAREALVLLDRFFLSTYAYQVAGRGLPYDQVVTANRLATAELRPDVTLLLALPVDEGMKRVSQRGSLDRMERADAGFHERVAKAFAEFATAEWQNAHPEAGPVVTVDAQGDVQQVFGRLQSALERRWPGTFRTRTT
jgi:dTMP kinase